jgi:hypothetical protein
VQHVERRVLRAILVRSPFDAERIPIQNLIQHVFSFSVGHSGKFGHEFLEFELRPDGKLRYANNSQYKKDSIIRKEVYVGDAVVQEFKRIVESSEILKYECFVFMGVFNLPFSFR